ncbi:MAG: hypothetical protein R3200_10570 [Xanthomonadales bacterium]|nr:hypothetical protein [Xanthomonadales bacterium]
MRFYDIYEHPDWGRQVVPLGFCWPAFLVPTAWAAAKGLGTITLLLVVASTLMFDLLNLAISAIETPVLVAMLAIASFILFGIRPGSRASRWHAEQLRAEGYRCIRTVVAADRAHALSAGTANPLLRAGRAPLVLLTYGESRWPGYQLTA